VLKAGFLNPDFFKWDFEAIFFFKMGICFLPRKKYLRLTGKILNTRVRLDQAHKMH
jgi:hypothetical protein